MSFSDGIKVKKKELNQIKSLKFRSKRVFLLSWAVTNIIFSPNVCNFIELLQANLAAKAS